MIVALLIAVLLVIANGAFVAVEFALLAVGRSRLETLADEGSTRAQHALDATGDLSLQLAGSQFGITVASLLLGFVGEPTVGHLIEVAIEPLGLSESITTTIGFGVGLAIVVFVHMVFGEMVPKNLALAAPERVLLALILPARAYLVVAGPIVRFLNAVSNGITRLLGIEPRDELVASATADEIAAMVASSRQEGLIADVEHQLLTGALDLGAQRVGDVMVRWPDVVSVPRSTTPAEAEGVVVRSGHSRLVVTGADDTDVLGYLHAKDLLTLSAEARHRAVPLGRIRRVPVVAPDRPIDDVLVIMQRARVHLALVRDGEGRTSGIVSLEDVLEELVGDIVDESDRGPDGARRRGRVTRSQ